MYKLCHKVLNHKLQKTQVLFTKFLANTGHNSRQLEVQSNGNNSFEKHSSRQREREFGEPARQIKTELATAQLLFHS